MPRLRGDLGDVGGRLDTQRADAAGDAVLQQVSVVAGHLDHERVGAEIDSVRAASSTNRRACATQESE